ncbi:MAG: ribosomal protein S18-alanine N-acetyltransferase [Gammaproteobacteria bacterium]|nr:ribosomal protein S18-alanine N-acetyltransferase [Gammaproteobacteria bacterium]
MSAVVSEGLPMVRSMREQDLPAVLEVERAAYEFPWTLGIFRDCLTFGYTCRVYQNARGLIGHGIMSVGAGECHMLNICVHPGYQRRGLGVHMVRHLMDLARAQKARSALLEVRASNVAAYRLYTGIGFNEIGVRKGYYPARNGREDAIILACEL